MVKLSNFDTQLLKKRDVGKTEEKTVLMTLKNKQPTITPEDIGDIQDDLLERAKERNMSVKFMIRAKNINRWLTFKTFDEKVFIQSTMDYYDGKVKDKKKFEQFSQLEITILTSK
jgi:hypothetical protein